MDFVFDPGYGLTWFHVNYDGPEGQQYWFSSMQNT